jgi:anti-sigma regulatory factor (Ser/Thr protein kinase)
MTRTGKHPGEQRRLKLPRNASAPGLARRYVAGLLRGHEVPERARENALLVSSELVSNAYLHGRGDIELRVGVDDDRLRIEVIDEGRDQAPAVREQPDQQVGGWGLQIVDQLALQWGVFEGTTHVWADLALG